MEDRRQLRLAGRLSLTGLALVVVLVMAPLWWWLLQPDPVRPWDFFQDYASARNLLTGRPVYTHLTETMYAYRGIDMTGRKVDLPYNAHPPTSVLLALPLAGLDYPTAGAVWNLLSLALLAASLVAIARALAWRPSPWSLLPLLALLLTWVPLWLHIVTGQWSLLLLALLVAAWLAGRRGQDGWCGAWLGLAATIKLFPLLLLGYLLLRGRWRAALSGSLTFVAVSGLTLLLTGPQTYIDYLTVALPSLSHWRADWINASLTGFFARLFAPDPTTQPLLASPLLALALTALASLAVVAAIAWHARHRPDFDTGFSLALTGTLLLSALTWSHYFVVLLLPLAVWARRLWPAGRAAAGRWAVLLASWALMALPQRDLAFALVPGGEAGVASPALALTLLALHFYGLLAFFLAQLWWSRSLPVPASASEQPALTPAREPAALGAVAFWRAE